MGIAFGAVGTHAITVMRGSNRGEVLLVDTGIDPAELGTRLT